MSQRKQVDTEKWHVGQEVTLRNSQTTDRDRITIERRKLIHRLEKVKWSDQTLDQLKAVINLLPKPEAD